MSESSSIDSPKRRRGNDDESSGGKVLPIILVVIILGLGFALFKRGSSASAQAEADAKTIASLSNRVSEIETRLVLEKSNIEVARTNHQAAFDRRTAELLVTSNRLVQTRQLLDRADTELTAVRHDVSARATAIGALESQREELQRTAAVIPRLEREAIELRKQLARTQIDRAALQETLGRARAEKADLERKLEDPLFLKLQERRVLEAAEMRQRAAAGQRIDISDPRVRLELQPDGTVRSTTAAAGASGR